ncbi:hypothetical protein PR048_026645 [Dryococelus australis]|uniref:Uncharacterized protein n=1 Tax=Dryococelus australis TaxID=614101 RepID=A0ABQ9GLY6_9NEOP|nr:hypothetical protein PR048_026645 [Dryococelus australis]
MNDPLLDCEPFLDRFQSQKPLLLFLCTALEEVVNHLLMRFVKQEQITEASIVYKHKTFDLSDSDNLIPAEKVDVGCAAKKLLKKNLKFKSLLKSHLAQRLTCFNPEVNLLQSGLGLKRVDIDVLEELHGAKSVCKNLVLRTKKQYVNLTVEAQSEKLAYLWHVIKLCLILSRGNASLESGFSVNKYRFVENLLEESLVAQRIICDTCRRDDYYKKHACFCASCKAKIPSLFLEEKELNAGEEKHRSEKGKLSNSSGN